MTAPLQHDQRAINAVLFGIAWFKPLGAANAISAKRWATTLPKPYRWVARPTGSRTDDGDYPTLWIYTLAATYTDAANEADRTDSRAMVLVDYPGWPTTMPDGSAAHCDWAEITEAAHEIPYAAETVATCFVTEMRLGFSFVPA